MRRKENQTLQKTVTMYGKEVNGRPSGSNNHSSGNTQGGAPRNNNDVVITIWDNSSRAYYDPVRAGELNI